MKLIFPAWIEISSTSKIRVRAAAAALGLGVRESRLVRHRPGGPPAFMLVRLGFGPVRERPLRALTLKTAAGADTAEARRIYEGRPRTGGHTRNRVRP